MSGDQPDQPVLVKRSRAHSENQDEEDDDHPGDVNEVNDDEAGETTQPSTAAAAEDCSFRRRRRCPPSATSPSPPVVKLIDFANVTFPGLSKDDIYHHGPDRGLMFGLDSSIEILNKILSTSTDESSSELWIYRPNEGIQIKPIQSARIGKSFQGSTWGLSMNLNGLNTTNLCVYGNKCFDRSMEV